MVVSLVALVVGRIAAALVVASVRMLTNGIASEVVVQSPYEANAARDFIVQGVAARPRYLKFEQNHTVLVLSARSAWRPRLAVASLELSASDKFCASAR